MIKGKILIVEDEAIIANDIKEILEAREYVVLGIATNIEKAVEMLDSRRPDLVLIDIMMNGKDDGLRLAEVLDKEYKIPFIFVTANSSRAIVQKAKSTNPSGYIVKPFKDEDIQVAVDMVLFNCDDLHQTIIKEPAAGYLFSVNGGVFVKDGDKYKKINTGDIFWLKADGNYVEIETRQKKFVLRGLLKDLIQRLPENKFIRIHKSYMVPRENISHVEYFSLTVNDQRIPIGRKFRKTLYKELGLE